MHFLSFISLGGALLLLSSQHLLAQTEWEPEVNEKYTLLQDYCNSNHYEAAYPSYQWLKHEKPDLHENLYIFGIKILKSFGVSETDSAKRRSYFDELAEAYDLRMKHFGDSAGLSLRKALDLYAFKLPGMASAELKAFNEAFQWNAGKLPSHLLVAYMHVLSSNFDQGLVTEDEFINRYLEIVDSFAAAHARQEDEETLKKHQAICENLFLSLVTLDCNQIGQKFGNSFQPDADNAKERARIIVRLSLLYKCTGQSYFPEAMSVYYESSPSYALASFLGNKAREEGDAKMAKRYFEDMIKLSENDDQKAKSFLLLAWLYFNSDKMVARNYVVKALTSKPGFKEAYSLWGDLYFYSFKECKQEESQVQDRAVYLAAYEKYRQAGEAEKMKLSEKYFPAIDDIHLENYRLGDAIRCGCWIDEEVVLRKRAE